MDNQILTGVATIVTSPRGSGILQVLFGLRKGGMGAGTWGLPGGHLEFGEEPVDAALRELYEETGLYADDIWTYTPYPWVCTHMPELGRQYITLYFLATTRGEAQLLEADKFERWAWFPYNKWPRPLFAPFADGKLEQEVSSLGG